MGFNEFASSYANLTLKLILGGKLYGTNYEAITLMEKEPIWFSKGLRFAIFWTSASTPSSLKVVVRENANFFESCALLENMEHFLAFPSLFSRHKKHPLFAPLHFPPRTINGLHPPRIPIDLPLQQVRRNEGTSGEGRFVEQRHDHTSHLIHLQGMSGRGKQTFFLGPNEDELLLSLSSSGLRSSDRRPTTYIAAHM